MAKSPWILYGASGKVGNIVLQRSDKKTIVRERVTTIKNPRSTEQQSQRMKISTVMSAYSTLKEICNHSFEGISYGAKSMQYFMKQNYIRLNGEKKPYYNFRENKTLVPNHYMLSKGSIVLNADEDTVTNPEIPAYTLSESKTNLPTLTVQEFHDLLGINVGDQITFIVVGVENDAPVFEYKEEIQVATSIKYARYIFDPSKASKTVAKSGLASSQIIDTANLLPESEIPNQFDVLLDAILDLENISIAPTYSLFPTTLGISMIVSRKQNGTWLRSTANLLVPSQIEPTSLSLETYGPTDKYLNNAAD